MNWAHLHLLLNHTPVLGAFLMTGVIALAIVKKDRALAQLCLQLIVLIGILTLPAYFTGEPSEDVVEHLPGVSEALISKHESIALYALLSTEVMAVLALIGAFVSRREAGVPKRLLGILFFISLLNILTMTWTANLGGQIRHTEVRDPAPVRQNPGES